MDEITIYDKVFNKVKQCAEIADKIIFDGRDEILISEFPELDNIDQNRICFDIDQFVKECPTTYERYLYQLLDEYKRLKRVRNKYFEEIRPVKCEGNERIFDFFWTICYIIDHLQFVLGIERERFIDLLDRYKKAVIPSFEGLFRDRDNAQKVRDILETNGYTFNGQWQGLTNDKSQLLCAYYALKPILKQGKITPQVKLFYKTFRLPDDYISDRMKTTEQFNTNRDEFDLIFSHLIPEQ